MVRQRRTFSSVLILGLLLVLTIGPGLAQEPEGEASSQPDLAIEPAVSSKFSYQGVLKEGGSPVSGSRDMIFRLYADDACTTQVGADIAKPGVPVASGLFSVELEVDQSHFDGQGLWLAVEVDGTALACQEILPVPYALGLRPGAVIRHTDTALSVYSGEKYALWGESATTEDWYTAVRGKVTGATGITSGVVGTSDSVQGRGVFGQATADSGATSGVYGHTYSSSDYARGVYGLASADSGLTYGVRGDTKSTGGQGVHGRAQATTGETYGVYGKSESTDGGGGGYFAGYTGVFGLGTGADGYGGYFESAQDDGVRVESAGDNGVYVDYAAYHGVSIYQADESGVFVGDVGDAGLWVWLADEDGVRVSAAGDDGVYADTLVTNNEWGFYTPDKSYAGTTLVSGGSLMLVAQNDDSRDLETGDVVAVSGVGAPFAGGDTPVPRVQKAGQANGTAAVGVVYRRLVAEEEVEEVERDGQVERRTRVHARSGEGPVAPGDYLLLVVMGPAQVKAGASPEGIRPGDLLTAAADEGQSAKAEPVEVGGAAFYAPGTIVGKAMEPLRGAGLIWVWVTLR
jgi:hypothetical protein